MAYSSGGLITATDYNQFVGTNPSSTANRINTVWATGNGQYGYGQTAIPTVSGTGLVTATQWGTAINVLNSIRTHQTGSSTGLTAPTSGQLAAYLTNFSANVNNSYTDAMSCNTNGTTTTGTVYTPTISAATGVSYAGTVATRTITFASGDAARYFFNCGGKINLVITSVTNNNSTARSADAVSVLKTYFGGVSGYAALTAGTQAGTGGTVLSIGQYPAAGYWGGGGTADVTDPLPIIQIGATGGGAYSLDYMQLYVYGVGYLGYPLGSNADVGNLISLRLDYNSPSTGSFNTALNVTVNHRVDIVYPETTNLTNSWGTATVS